MRECHLDKHEAFWTWYIQFIEHFIAVYDREAPRYDEMMDMLIVMVINLSIDLSIMESIAIYLRYRYAEEDSQWSLDDDSIFKYEHHQDHCMIDVLNHRGKHSILI